MAQAKTTEQHQKEIRETIAQNIDELAKDFVPFTQTVTNPAKKL
jgi:hypothetical protein